MEGNILLAAGTLLDDLVIRKLAEKGRQKRYPAVCMMEHASISSDLETYLARDPYHEIFGGDDGILGFLRRLGEIPIPVPLLDAFESLRERDPTTYHHSLIVFSLRNNFV